MIRLGSLLLLQILAILSYSQILAIDYGTQFIKAALVHTGAGKTFSIVENSKSQRKFINAVHIMLLRWGSITRRGSMRLTLLPRDHEVHLIVSSSPDY